jgi:hypothetical protein
MSCGFAGENFADAGRNGGKGGTNFRLVSPVPSIGFKETAKGGKAPFGICVSVLSVKGVMAVPQIVNRPGVSYRRQAHFATQLSLLLTPALSPDQCAVFHCRLFVGRDNIAFG